MRIVIRSLDQALRGQWERTACLHFSDAKRRGLREALDLIHLCGQESGDCEKDEFQIALRTLRTGGLQPASHATYRV